MADQKDKTVEAAFVEDRAAMVEKYKDRLPFPKQ